jgi:pyrimidine deaminase RibD-like protein
MAIDESHLSIPEHQDKTDPLVGAIISTKDDVLLAKAHRGELSIGQHCEFTLIEKKLTSINIKDCVLYVTLEPCTNESKNKNKGKKGCATHIVNTLIGKVYIGIDDPSPKIATEGIRFLEEKGIKVEMFPKDLADEIRMDNTQFIKEKEKEALKAKQETAKPKQTILQQAAYGATIKSFSDTAVQKFISESHADIKYPSDEFNE